MRKHILGVLPSSEEEVEEEFGGLSETEIARRAMVLTFGPRTAAWLIMQHREQFHKTGTVDFVIPDKQNKVLSERLRWFFVAMEFLKKHRAGWEVAVRVNKKNRTYRVRWLNWDPKKNRPS